MRWTRETPTEAGWYWVRGDHRTRFSSHGGRPRVVCVVDGYTPRGQVGMVSGLVVVRGNGHYATVGDWKHEGAEWSGPIPPPEEASDE